MSRPKGRSVRAYGPNCLSTRTDVSQCRNLYLGAKVSGHFGTSTELSLDTLALVYTGWPKKRPELSHGVMQQSKRNESAEKHVCNEQTSSNMSMNFHLKRFHTSRDTSEIVLHGIKQCLRAVRHLCCWLYAGYTRTSY